MHQHGDEHPSEVDVVYLDTATGRLRYRLPLSLDRDTVGGQTVREILSAGTDRSSVAARRDASHLLGLEVDGRYRYPLFQFDRDRRCISPVAAYANEALQCQLDPWGTLDWWFTAHLGIHNERPVDRLIAGHLTEADVDRLVALELQGMD
ncbi:hypothetical protein HF877_06205 [Rhodococcus sp. BL-253-APC-6A1W]|uniref:hypothetical protein n=1 Tax=Rhodococcus sp. BL-253-APC-6A1W TaxID=2725307 RepID=UPI00146B05B9|nr:hypothetical protein [Rhodococcus sp. BL-253-APC-6A1W]NMD94996.1 hypothetical protein [Rhodococcus sp. BL-253-APC-6A1W]